jgi:hypothetical protein
MIDILPLVFQIVVDFPVGDGHHDDEDPEEDDADQELVNGPHRDGRGLQVTVDKDRKDEELNMKYCWQKRCKLRGIILRWIERFACTTVRG